jgi:phytoene dehydrogenase-like protein
MSAPRTALVVGAGPAGLTVANLLLDAGVEVTVLEAKARPGGRAASDVVDGFVLNQGPHALYPGAGRRVLRGLGIDPPGRLPVVPDPVLVRDGRLVRPAAALARFAARVARTRPADVAHLTALEWLGDDPVGTAAIHVATYTGPLDRLSADAALANVRVAARGVRYLHGGWQSIVDALARRAGDVVRTGASVRALERDGGGWAALTVDGEHHADVVVVAAGGPERAARLLGVDVPSPGPEAEASVLDIGLDRLPRRSKRFALGLDAPRYFSVHSPPARLGGLLADVASYGRATREDLEAFASVVQPGWQDHAVMTRHLPAMTTITAIPTPETGGLAGRPGVAVPGAPGAYVAGDWVGPEGMLLDAALASAAAAARAVLTADAREAVPA